MNFKVLQEKALKLGIKEIEIYTVKQNGLSMSFLDETVEGNTTQLTDVTCVRGVYNNQVSTVYTEKQDEEAMDFVLQAIIKNTTLITKDEPFFIYGGDKEYPKINVKETNFENAKAIEKINLAKQLDKLLKEKSSYVYKTQSAYEEGISEYNIVNSNGLNVTKTNKGAYLVCEVIVKKDEDVKTAFDYLEIYKMEDIDLDKFADKLIEKAVSQFGAEQVPSGEYDIVLDKNAVRSLLGVYSQVFCADYVLKKMSFLEDKVGQKIFGDNVTIIDDPLNTLASECDSFDDEGVSTKTKVIVENGVLKTYLHNLTTASMMKTKSTGNGFKASIASPVGVGPKNFYLKPGQHSIEELFNHVNNGLYITSFTGLHAGVNMVSGDYSLQANGYKIENGKKTTPVTLIIVSSSFQETFNKITMIGNDFEFRNSVGSSSISLSKMSVSGK